MALSIVNNPISIGAQASVNGAQTQLSKTIKALSTGLRINSAADDASGLAVSEKLRGQISGLAKAATNAQDAISMLQTADSAMGSMSDMVQRMRELAIQAGNPGYTTNDRAVLQSEIDQLKEEINRVSTTTEFNTKKLLNGDASGYWSSNSDSLEAIIKGSVTNGNYIISAVLTAGSSAEYKSNIFQVWDATQSAYRSAQTTDSLTAITSFLDQNGNFILDNTQDLTIFTGNGEQATVSLGKGDTVQTLINKLQEAIKEASGSSGSVTLDSGILTLKSTEHGANSNITFVGSEKLIKALSFKETKAAKEDGFTLNLKNTAGDTIGTSKSYDGVIRGLIDGIDLKVSDITANKTFRLSIKDNTTKAIIGANEGQTLDISIGRLDTVSMGLQGINVANIESAEKAATKLDMALEQINKTRSTVGAQMNRLEYTVANLNTSRENMTAAESRIRDLDIAQASSELAAQQVLMQSASAMLAQANLMPSYAIQLIK